MVAGGLVDVKLCDVWKSSFGDEYTKRNTPTPNVVRACTAAWHRIAQGFKGDPPRSALEVGANVGVNLGILASLFPSIRLHAVEPNDLARRTLIREQSLPREQVFDCYAHEIPLPDESIELVFTVAVLMHVPPAWLEASVKEIYRVASKYVLAVEYFSAGPKSVEYRGQMDLLYTNDYGALYLKHFPDLKVLDYGFFWKPVTGLDNLTWWLFEKQTGTLNPDLPRASD